jgi:group I intron endonuclease
MKISCIYKIESKLKPERFYIGSAVNYKHRKNCHLYDLRKKRHGSKKLQNHYNKYGESDLYFSIIEECDVNSLLTREQHYLDSLNPYFNILKKADNSLGFKHSFETIQKLKEVRKLQSPASLETRQKMSSSRLGHPNYLLYHTEETKRKISEANKGKISWNKGKSSWNKGLKMSEEARRNMSIARKGKKKSKPMSQETKLKIGNATRGRLNFFKGKKRSLENCKKISESKMGHIVTEETRKKISESKKKQVA